MVDRHGDDVRVESGREVRRPPLQVQPRPGRPQRHCVHRGDGDGKLWWTVYDPDTGWSPTPPSPTTAARPVPPSLCSTAPSNASTEAAPATPSCTTRASPAAPGAPTPRWAARAATARHWPSTAASCTASTRATTPTPCTLPASTAAAGTETASCPAITAPKDWPSSPTATRRHRNPAHVRPPRLLGLVRPIMFGARWRGLRPLWGQPSLPLLQ